jgi:hypothetical protein
MGISSRLFHVARVFDCLPRKGMVGDETYREFAETGAATDVMVRQVAHQAVQAGYPGYNCGHKTAGRAHVTAVQIAP